MQNMKSRTLFTRFLGLAVAMLLIAGSSQVDAFWSSHGGGYGSYGGGRSFGGGSYGGVSVSVGGGYGSAGSHGGLLRSARYSMASRVASRGSYGSAGGFASSVSRGSYGSAGSHGVGPIRRLVQNIRSRRASHGSYGGASYGSAGSHGGYSASYGSAGSHGGYSTSYGSAGSHGGYSTSYGSAGSHGGYSTPSYSTPSYYSAPSYSAPSYGSAGGVISTGSHGGYFSSTTGGSSTVIASAEQVSGSLAVHVPVGAVVYVNDHKTTSTGTMRAYVSHGLKSGQSYNYNVRVEYEQNGKTVTETKVATLTGGGEANLAFGQPTPMVAETTKTKLTLSVPTAAKVTLAGANTRQTGSERQYITKNLPEGETWDSYTVRVEVAGSTQERTITLRGGEAQHLVFSFDTLASVN